MCLERLWASPANWDCAVNTSTSPRSLSVSTQNLLTDFHQSCLLEHPTAASSEVLEETGGQNVSHFTPAYSLICPAQFKITRSSPTTTTPEYDTQSSSAPFDITKKDLPKTQTKTDFSGVSAWDDNCKLGGW